MPKACPACVHPQRQEIDQAILQGAKLPDVARNFALPYWTIFRHKQRGHLSRALVKAQQAHEVTRADNLLGQVESLQTKALELLNKAEKAGQLRTALHGVREAKGCLELLAKLQGDLAQEGNINIVLSPSWMSLRTVILKTLEPYPEARLRIAEALSEVNHAGQ
jgi:hypothetical protein